MKLVKGAQSIAYDRAPYLISSASVVGKKEGEGPIGEMFDLVGEVIRLEKIRGRKQRARCKERPVCLPWERRMSARIRYGICLAGIF